jgi:hypothetical protein
VVGVLALLDEVLDRGTDGDALDTVCSRAFIYGWDAPGRVLRSCVEAAEAVAGEVVGETPSLDGTRERR